MFRLVRKIIYFHLIIPVRYSSGMNTERLISLDTSNDRDNIGFVINEKEEKKKRKWGSCCAMNLNMEAVCHDTWCWAEREINLLRRLIVPRSWIAAAPLDLDRQIPKTFRTSQLFFKEFFSKKLFANFKLIRFDTNKNITINSTLLFKKREREKKRNANQ